MTSAPNPWTAAGLESALGRAPRPMDLTRPLSLLAGERVLVTGGAGSIGTEVVRVLTDAGGSPRATDVDELDVRVKSSVQRAFGLYRPTVVFHLAGAKHAPEGERDPQSVLEVNAVGTENVIAAATVVGARVVTASTCKACDPETAYGASKLLAERLTLAAGGNVARFYNVIETAGNVFEIWNRLPRAAPLPVTACNRYFITLAEATGLIFWAAVAPHGRYTIDPGEPRFIPQVAADLHPGRAVEQQPPRRGDRVAEPRHAACEQVQQVSGPLEQVWGPHDAFGDPRLATARAA